MMDFSMSLQVEVSVNGIPASCRSRNCSFTFSEDLAPKVHSVFPQSGGQDGSPITIYGSNFSNNASLVTVFLGDADCVVVTANETEITCIPTSQTAGLVTVRVHIANIGYSIATMSNRERRESEYSRGHEITFEYSIIVDSVTPNIGSISGTNVVAISGIGFPIMEARNSTDANLTDDFYVLFDSYPCFVVESSLTQILCQPQPHSPGMVSITVSVNDLVSAVTDAYQYSLSSTAIVDSVTPGEGPVTGGTELSLAGANFGTCLDCLYITIGDSYCVVTSLTDSEILCTTMDHEPGNYPIFIHSSQFGIALLREVTENPSSVENLATGVHVDYFSKDSGSGYELSSYNYETSGDSMFHMLPVPTFAFKLMVTGVSPCDGSILGGTTLKITGSGFGSNMEVTSVTTSQGRQCELTFLDDTTIQCTMPSSSREHIITNYDSK